MFQIEPILWLRSLASPPLDWLMATVSQLGYSEVYGALMTILIFGYKIKKGLAVLVAAFLVGLLTHSLKTGLAFPRPSDIDMRVVPEGYLPPLQLSETGVGKGFWDLPSSEALQLARKQHDWSYGLPSGHVSAATAMLLGLALFFRAKKVLWFSAIWIPLMCMSRMYLGRHFLADVIGGMIVGAVGVCVAWLLLKKFHEQVNNKPVKESIMPFAAVALTMALLAPFSTLIHSVNAGRFFSLVFVYLYLIKTGIPSDDGNFWQRTGRVLMAGFLYFMIDMTLDLIKKPFDWDDLPLGAMLSIFISSLGSFIGTVYISRNLKLYIV